MRIHTMNRRRRRQRDRERPAPPSNVVALDSHRPQSEPEPPPAVTQARPWTARDSIRMHTALINLPEMPEPPAAAIAMNQATCDLFTATLQELRGATILSAGFYGPGRGLPIEIRRHIPDSFAVLLDARGEVTKVLRVVAEGRP